MKNLKNKYEYLEQLTREFSKALEIRPSINITALARECKLPEKVIYYYVNRQRCIPYQNANNIIQVCRYYGIEFSEAVMNYYDAENDIV